jgi:hypothetical protein
VDDVVVILEQAEDGKYCDKIKYKEKDSSDD